MQDGWVRVHSDEDEKRSEEEMLTFNIIMGLVENLMNAPHQLDEPEANLAWWKKHPDWEKQIKTAASDIAAEYRVGRSAKG